MNIRYDPESGAGYLHIREGRYEESVEVAPGCYLALDEDGQVMGLEFLSFEELAQAATMSAGGLALPERIEDPAHYRPART